MEDEFVSELKQIARDCPTGQFLSSMLYVDFPQPMVIRFLVGWDAGEPKDAESLLEKEVLERLPYPNYVIKVFTIPGG